MGWDGVRVGEGGQAEHQGSISPEQATMNGSFKTQPSVIQLKHRVCVLCILSS